jgi:hypothetical protein
MLHQLDAPGQVFENALVACNQQLPQRLSGISIGKDFKEVVGRRP